MKFSRVIMACVVLFFGSALRVAAEEATADKREVAALVVDKRYLDSAKVRIQLNRYRENVEREFGVRLLQFPGNIDLTPDETRTGLQKLHDEQQIKGVIFVGQFRFARFKNASGDVCTLPEFYEDLDGQFDDTDGDGLYDVYDPWHGDESDDAAGSMDIWISMLRPYYNTPQDFRSPDDVATYFRKVNVDLERDKPDTRKSAQIFTSSDWPNQTGLSDALRELYDEPTKVYGGYDQNHQAQKTSVQQFQEAVATPSELLFVFAHSGPSQHIFDLPAYPGNLILPGVLDLPGRALLEATPVKPKIMLLWGCHTADFEGINYRNNRFLADSYLLTPENSVLTLLGNSKSIGLEDLPFLLHQWKGESLQTAWLKYLNHVYSKRFLKDWLGSRGVWEKERTKFVWGYIICGNPFTRVG